MLRYIQITKNQRHPARFLFSRFLRHSGLWRLFRIHLNGYVLRLHPASLSMSLWVNPEDRNGDTEVIHKLLRDGETYVDVGANIGQLAIEGGLAVGSAGKVFAFEAHPRTAKFLQENVQLNKLSNIRIAQLAVGNSTGWITFTDVRSDDQNRVTQGSSGIAVPVVPLGLFFGEENVKLLKIDVEGFEKFILEGLGDAIDNIDYIYFEVMDSHFREYGYQYSDIHDFLISAGYQVGVFRDGLLDIVQRDQAFGDCVNLLAFRDLEELRQRMGIIL